MILDTADPEGGWVDTHHFHKVEETEEKIGELTLDEKGVEAQVCPEKGMSRDRYSLAS
jgi:hypothetical protein